jgi:4-amino-4-deoxy-L-arabinose transferase-like glycosyltransferase
MARVAGVAGESLSGARRPAHPGAWLAVVLLAAFALRAGAGALSLGGLRGTPPDTWWLGGYSAYGDMAVSLAEGRGLRRGDLVAPRPPLYPLLLAAVYRLGGPTSALPVLVQAGVGTGSVALAHLIGRAAFGPAAGLLAAAMTAAYPYYVAHDTALQETSLFTLLVAMSVHGLLVARRSGRPSRHALAGASVGLALLCRESLVPFVPLATLWLGRPLPGRGWGRSTALAAVFAVSAIVVVGPWLARNAQEYGAPLFASRLGYRVWIGHNEATLSRYPWASIDRSTDEALARMDPAERAAVDRLPWIERDRWFLRRAGAFALENPARVARYAIVKLVATFGPLKSPLDRSWVVNVVYSVSWIGVCVLAILGLRLGPPRDLVVLVALLALAFLVVVLATHGHTSHRSHLDLYLLVLGAGPVARAWRRRSAGAPGAR